MSTKEQRFLLFGILGWFDDKVADVVDARIPTVRRGKNLQVIERSNLQGSASRRNIQRAPRRVNKWR